MSILTAAQVRVLAWVDISGHIPKGVQLESTRVVYSHCEKVPGKRSYTWRVKDEQRSVLAESIFWRTVEGLKQAGGVIQSVGRKSVTLFVHGRQLMVCDNYMKVVIYHGDKKMCLEEAVKEPEKCT